MGYLSNIEKALSSQGSDGGRKPSLYDYEERCRTIVKKFQKWAAAKGLTKDKPYIHSAMKGFPYGDFGKDRYELVVWHGTGRYLGPFAILSIHHTSGKPSKQLNFDILDVGKIDFDQKSSMPTEAAKRYEDNLAKLESALNKGDLNKLPWSDK